MNIKNIFAFLFLYFLCLPAAFANPHWNEKQVPKDRQGLERYDDWKSRTKSYQRSLAPTSALRITVAWDEKTESYSLLSAAIENSGTPSLLVRSKKPSSYGSYKASVQVDGSSVLFYDSVGTGKEYRKLVRQISFRFPVPSKDFTFKMQAEHPVKGSLETVFEEKIKISSLKNSSPNLKDVDIRQLKLATQSPSLEVVFYAEGFKLANKDVFFKSALKALDTLNAARIPHFNNMNFVAVFATSNTPLGSSKNLGLPVKRRDSAFGLFYPYWNDFGRWNNVVYPTDEDYFRNSLSVVPYDYNIMLVDSSNYWGVANYKSHTAIPIRNGSFEYLLLHEFGHFFGLNEEYDGGGRTELEFAPETIEVWSQNMTFLPIPKLENLKWESLVLDKTTPIPTPDKFWKFRKYGAYSGGYGDSNGKRKSYKPDQWCVMDRYDYFCDICRAGIKSVVDFDLGL